MINAKTAPGSIKGGERLIPFLQIKRKKRALPHLMAQGLGLEIDPAIPLTTSIPFCGKLLGIGKALAYSVSYQVND